MYNLVLRWWSSAYLVSVYCNSLLASLNVRKAIRERGQENLPITMHFIEDLNGSTMGNRQVDGFVSQLCYTVSHPTPRLGNRH